MRFLHPIAVAIALGLVFCFYPGSAMPSRFDGLFILGLVLCVAETCGVWVSVADLSKRLAGHPFARTLNIAASLALFAIGCRVLVPFLHAMETTGHSWDLVLLIPGALLTISALAAAIRLAAGFSAS